MNDCCVCMPSAVRERRQNRDCRCATSVTSSNAAAPRGGPTAMSSVSSLRLSTSCTPYRWPERSQHMLTDTLSLLQPPALRAGWPVLFATFLRLPFCGMSMGCGVSSQFRTRRGSLITLVTGSITPASISSASRPNSP